MPFESNSVGLEVRGNYAYLGYNAGYISSATSHLGFESSSVLDIVDISVPSDPETVSSISLPESDERTQVMLANQQDLLIARTTAMNGRVNVLQQRIRQLESNRSGLIEQNNTTNILLASYKSDLNDQNELLNLS